MTSRSKPSTLPILVATALSFLALTAPSAEPASEQLHCHEVSLDDDVQTVRSIMRLEDGRIGVSFSELAAIYYLSEEHECFDHWYALMTESLKTRRAVRFSHSVEAQITVVALVDVDEATP